VDSECKFKRKVIIGLITLNKKCWQASTAKHFRLDCVIHTVEVYTLPGRKLGLASPIDFNVHIGSTWKQGLVENPLANNFYNFPVVSFFWSHWDKKRCLFMRNLLRGSRQSYIVHRVSQAHQDENMLVLPMVYIVFFCLIAQSLQTQLLGKIQKVIVE